jgi:hypothetical protein
MLRKCSRCHSELLEDFFSKNRKGELKKCCDNCLKMRIKHRACDKCDFKCSYNTDLIRHKKEVHLELKPCKCDQCDEKFSIEGDLHRHKKAVHFKIQPFACDQCDLIFSQNGNLQQHKNSVHLKLKPFDCSDCDAKFSTKGHLKEHKKAVHLNLKPFACLKCDYKSAVKGKLTRHLLTCGNTLNCSVGEIKVMKILDDLAVDYAYDRSYEVIDKSYLRWDFRIHGKEPAFIEYDGECHYFPIRYGGISEEKAQENLESSQRRDKIKDQYCDDNGYLLLRIPYWEKKNIEKLVSEFIHENFIQQP